MAQQKSPTKAKAASGTVTRKTSGAVTTYLVAYNVISAGLWFIPLVITIFHLFGIDPQTLVNKSWHSYIQTWASYVPFTAARAKSTRLATLVPKQLLPYVLRAKTTYSLVGVPVKWIQTAAALEIVHSLVGWVRSPLQTTAMQVYSRLFVVWAVVDQFPHTQTNPLYTSMVLAWCFTEVIRYLFYAANLLNIQFYPLIWLRYTTFYILYPIGASSEAFIIFAALPLSLYTNFKSTPPTVDLDLNLANWKPADYYRAGMFLIWWPSLYALYSYMISQRRKVLGSAKKTSSAKKSQ